MTKKSTYIWSDIGNSTSKRMQEGRVYSSLFDTETNPGPANCGICDLAVKWHPDIEDLTWVLITYRFYETRLL